MSVINPCTPCNKELELELDNEEVSARMACYIEEIHVDWAYEQAGEISALYRQQKKSADS